MKWVFWALLSINAVVFLWQLFSKPEPPVQIMSTDPGTPSLVLLDELVSSSADVLVPLSQVNSAHAQKSCLSIGPFSQESFVYKAAAVLRKAGFDTRSSESQVREADGYWVLVPAADTREVAEQIGQELRNSGVDDYHIVASGKHRNAISLGLFKDETSAQNGRVRYANLGFNAQVEPRYRNRPEYWLTIEEFGNHRLPIPLWNNLSKQFSGLTKSEARCQR